MLVGHRPNGLLRCARAFLHTIAAATLATAMAGCGKAHSSESGNDNMIFGLFKGKKVSVVDPSLGAALVRREAFPASLVTPPAAAYPLIRDLGADAPPPKGKLAPNPTDDQPIRAYVAPAAASLPGVAVVNFYDPKRETQFWEMNPQDGNRFGRRRAATFAPDQAKWLAYDAETVMTLPAGQILIHLSSERPIPSDSLFVYDIASDRVRSLSEPVTPDWAGGLPFKFVDTLQLTSEAVLVLFHSDKERLGPQRYVNHFDHLVLFSNTHREGVPVLTLSLEDGNVRRWGMVGKTLWLKTSDDRAAKPREAVWSLDLAKVL